MNAATKTNRVSVEEMSLETVVAMAGKGYNGALAELIARLDAEGDEAKDLLFQILRAAKK